MRKLFIAALMIAASFTLGLAQETTASNGATTDIPNMGRAPKEANGIGRADVRVLDQDGNPVKNASVKLESNRSDGFFCESWGATDARGVIALPPLHMGTLKLIVKAKGYQTQKIDVPASSLSDPVRVTLVKKR
jgi:hypothetical protein